MENRPLLETLKEAASPHGYLPYDQFIDLALYTPEHGYYMQADRIRVGKTPDADFYTSETNKDVFRTLLIESIQNILNPLDINELTFVEIGPESPNGLFEGADEMPFAGYKAIHPHEGIEIPKKSVVFGNEVLDAQPFKRVRLERNTWHELGVKVGENLELSEIFLPEFTEELRHLIDALPSVAPEGYTIDIPTGAETLIKSILAPDWEGLFLLFDYGKMWEDLIHHYHEGTARTYHKHQQGSDLLKEAGMRDITCHICWDRLFPILEDHGILDHALERQESFLVHHAKGTIRAILEQPGGLNNRNNQKLMELIHPAHFGDKFQVLFGIRELDKSVHI